MANPRTVSTEMASSSAPSCTGGSLGQPGPLSEVQSEALTFRNSAEEANLCVRMRCRSIDRRNFVVLSKLVLKL